MTMTRAEFRRIYKADKRDVPGLRIGQAAWNAASRTWPEVTRLYNGTKLDCFYRDDRLTPFLDRLTELGCIVNPKPPYENEGGE